MRIARLLVLLWIPVVAVLAFQNCSGGFSSRLQGSAIASDALGSVSAFLSQPGSQSIQPAVSVASGASAAALSVTSSSSDPFAVPSIYSNERAGFITSFGGSVAAPSFGTTAAGAPRAVYYFSDSHNLSAYGVTGAAPVWKIPLETAAIVPSLDWDQDGVPDVFVVKVVPGSTPVTCINNQGLQDETLAMSSTALVLLSGATHAVLYESSAVPDYCFISRLDPANPQIEPIHQWSAASVIANSAQKSFAIAQYYAQEAFIFNRQASGSVVVNYLMYPSTSAYDAYTNSIVIDHNSGLKWVNQSHLFNGLFVGGDLEFFTSARFAAYSPASYGPSQLLFDLPVGAMDPAAGRNYGVIAKDPNSPIVGLVSGCSVNSVLIDLQNGSIGNNPQCGILRHVAMVDSSAQSMLGYGLFSYSNQGAQDALDYVNRITYPSNPILKWPGGGPSSLIYNSYVNGHWYLHISKPGMTDDLIRLQDKIVWDVIDIDQDGTDEILYSNATFANGNAYFPSRNTIVAHLNPLNPSYLDTVKTFTGVLPALVVSPKRDGVSSSEDALFSAVRVLGKAASLYVTDSSNTPRIADYIATSATPLGWVTTSDVAIRCQYPSEAPLGAQKSGGCASTGEVNTYEWASGEVGGCATGTILRHRVTQACQ